jgi:hypothetical protein
MDKYELRDHVIEWMHNNYPCLLADDELVEGFVYFCLRVWGQAVREERRRRIEACQNPRTFEMN